MKILGYLDDLFNKAYELQSYLGIWNWLIIPAEAIIISWLMFKFWGHSCYMD
jgi:hypothetical protein